MSIDATESTITPMDERVHQARPHPGQIFVSNRIRTILSDSVILTTHKNCNRVQDPYSFRCIPQVHGAVAEALQRLNDVVHTELNSATDNPLIFPDISNPGRHEIISQGNFHGEILALTADAMSLSLFEISSISERRIDQMLDPNRLAIKPFLADDAGLESGLMIVQYSAGASLGELHGHASPRTSFSTTTSAGQEDHVSMGSTACWNLLQAVQRASEVLACELFVARRGLHFMQNSSSKRIEIFVRCIDTIVIDDISDRTTSSELRDIATKLLDSAWLSLIESESSRIPKLIQEVSTF
jgi:histidine ammonia-lyase